MQVIDTLSPRDLALALGVSESSVRRWVDRGAIPSRRTGGGHRRISVPDALEYVRGAGLVLSRPEVLGLGLLAPPGSGAAEALHAALLRGDDREAIGLVLAAYVRGLGVAELCDEWIRPSLARIGELWRGGSEGILAEHRATAIALAALHRLRALLPEPVGLRALGGAVAGDPYALPSLMAAIVLQSEGFAATDLGPNTPAPVLREAIREQDPHLVWISVGHVGSRDEARSELASLLDDEAGARPFVLGGRCLADVAPSSRSNVHCASSMGELRALGLGLRSALKQERT